MQQLSLFDRPKTVNYKEFMKLIQKWKQEDAIVMHIFNVREDFLQIKTYVSFYMRKLEEIEFISILEVYEDKLIEKCMKKYIKQFK